jgi:hypothetical protein
MVGIVAAAAAMTPSGFTTGPHAPQPPFYIGPNASSRASHLCSGVAASIVHILPPSRQPYVLQSCSDCAERYSAIASERQRPLQRTPRAWLLRGHHTSTAW